MRRLSPLAGFTLLAALLALLSGCALAPKPIEPGRSVSIAVSTAPTWPGVKVRNESTGPSSTEGLAGAGAGALAGGLWGLACGPLAPLCVPLGVTGGATVGVVAGLAVGATAALPEDKAEQLRALTMRALQASDFRHALEDELVALGNAGWTVAQDASAADVKVELRELALWSTRDGRVRCVITVLLTVREPGVERPGVYPYQSAGAYASVATWLGPDGTLVDTELVRVRESLAELIVSTLAAKAAPGR